MKRALLAVGAAGALAAVTLVATAGGATAATTDVQPNSYISKPTGVHNAPSRHAPAVGTFTAGTPVQALCFIPDGDPVEGNTFWFRVETNSTHGWVPRAVIGGVPTDLPGC